MIILGYFFTVLNYIFYCSSRFQKEKKNILLLDVFAKIATIISFYLLGSLTGALNMGISLVLLFVASYKERAKNRFNPIISFMIFSAFFISYIGMCIYSFVGISSILITITSLMTLIAIWWLPPQKMRVTGAIVSVLYLAYQISIKNWAGLLEIFVIISNIVSYKKYKKKD